MNLSTKCPQESGRERILKIGLRLPKLRSKVKCKGSLLFRHIVLHVVTMECK